MRLTLQRDAAISDGSPIASCSRSVYVLREVDLSAAGFTARKLSCIRELGMGRNTKLQLQFGERVWLGAGCNGESASRAPIR